MADARLAQVAVFVSCEECGAETPKIRSTRRICDECRKSRRKEVNDRHRAKIGVLAVPQRIVCQRCEKEATVPTKRHKYCGACRSAAEGPSTHYYLRAQREVKRFGEVVACEQCSATMARRAAAHRFCSAECFKEYEASKRKAPRYRINNRMRAGIWATIKGKKAGRSWQRLVGYSAAALMEHLERQFQPGMMWENFGDWEIDHRRPLAAFSYQSPDDPEFKQAWALTNLQPLWAEENNRKRAKVLYLV